MPGFEWTVSAGFWAGAVALLFFVLGFFGCLLPVLPGPVLAWAGIVVHKLWLLEASVPWWFVGLATALMLAAQLVDFLLTAWGAKRFGASWKGAAGAVIGGLVGIFLPPPLLWIILGPVVGAILGEIFAGQNLSASGRAGFGTVVGGLLAMVTKVALTAAMIAGFYLTLVGTPTASAA